MRLNLSGGGTGRQTRMLADGTLSIGRGERNDWVLPDPDRHLSKTHCVISVENGRFVLTDLSTNGVTINGARTPTTRDSRVELTDGDSFRLGDYTIEVEEAEAGRAAPAAGPDPLHDDPLADPLSDPLGMPPARSGAPAFVHPVRAPAATPRGRDPFDEQDNAARRNPFAGDDLFQGTKPEHEWVGPSQPDNADAPRHAAPAMRVSVPQAPSSVDFDALIGDIPFLQPQAAPVARPAAPMPAAPPPAPGPAPAATPFDDFDSLLAPAAPPPAPAPPPPVAAPPPVAYAPPAASVAPPPQQPTAPQPAASGAGNGAALALAAFLDGAGVPKAAAGEDPEAALRTAGQVFRTLVEGLRGVLMSRTAIKGELRVEQTMMRSNNNNPLKFSFSAEDAVAALLGTARPGYMPPQVAAKEALDDIRMHELAVMAGVQTALRTLLERFSPEALEARLTQGLLTSMLPAARKARLWDNFRDLHHTIAGEAEDDFQAVFGRSFAKAYQEQSRKS